MSVPCQLCGIYHETTACPPRSLPVADVKIEYEGLKYEDRLIAEKLDRIIELLTAVQLRESTDG